jgi:hypothetical protein
LLPGYYQLYKLYGLLMTPTVFLIMAELGLTHYAGAFMVLFGKN